MDDARHRTLRAHMVGSQLEARGIRDERILDVFRRVPRHLFVPLDQEPSAYADRALPIGGGQTISQPFMVAIMLHLAAPTSSDRVLEVGTGLGYQAAILRELCTEVHTLERVGSLARRAREYLDRAGYEDVDVVHGDGAAGLPEHAPYDVIVVAAGANQIPAPLTAQLADGGRLVMPVGSGFRMEVVLLQKLGDHITQARGEPCLFVPLLEGTEE